MERKAKGDGADVKSVVAPEQRRWIAWLLSDASSASRGRLLLLLLLLLLPESAGFFHRGARFEPASQTMRMGNPALRRLHGHVWCTLFALLWVSRLEV